MPSPPAPPRDHTRDPDQPDVIADKTTIDERAMNAIEAAATAAPKAAAYEAANADSFWPIYREAPSLVQSLNGALGEPAMLATALALLPKVAPVGAALPEFAALIDQIEHGLASDDDQETLQRAYELARDNRRKTAEDPRAAPIKNALAVTDRERGTPYYLGADGKGNPAALSYLYSVATNYLPGLTSCSSRSQPAASVAHCRSSRAERSSTGRAVRSRRTCAPRCGLLLTATTGCDARSR